MLRPHTYATVAMLWPCAVAISEIVVDQVCVSVNGRQIIADAYNDFDIILDHFSRGHLLCVPPDTRRMLCSTSCPCLVDADWCSESDVVTDSRLFSPLKFEYGRRYGNGFDIILTRSPRCLQRRRRRAASCHHGRPTAWYNPMHWACPSWLSSMPPGVSWRAPLWVVFGNIYIHY